jgi:hypothetical protein
MPPILSWPGPPLLLYASALTALHSSLRHRRVYARHAKQSRARPHKTRRKGSSISLRGSTRAPAHGARSSHAHVCHDGDAPGRGYVSLRQTVPEHLLINSPNPHGFTKQRRKLNSVSNPHQDPGLGPRPGRDNPIPWSRLHGTPACGAPLEEPGHPAHHVKLRGEGGCHPLCRAQTEVAPWRHAAADQILYSLA